MGSGGLKYSKSWSRGVLSRCSCAVFVPWWLPGALLWLLTCLPARAQDAPPPSIESGFTSIDCGYEGPPYTDNSSLYWYPDRDFTGGGLPRLLYQVPEGLPVTRMAKTLRCFPTGMKNCYDVPVDGPGRYLIRLTFWYNNYDGQAAPPIFNVSVGLTPSGTIIMNTGDIFQPEFIATVNVSTISVCLIRVENNPIINALEIRPLPSNSYDADTFDNEVLWLWFRLTNGGVPDVSSYRFPNDPLDRIWLADVNTINYGSEYSISPIDLTINSSNVEVIGTFAAPNYVPPFVMQKNRLTAVPKSSLNFTFYDMDSPSLYQVYLYFAELSPLEISAGSRTFDVLFNNELVLSSMDVYKQAGERKFKAVTVSEPLQQNTDTLLIDFRPDPSSPLDPFINGMEIYQRRFLAIPTLAADTQALKEFRAGLEQADALAEWEGDPCYPVQWYGVVCYLGSLSTYVIQINLARANLSGPISPYIGNITSLKQLVLSGNNLSGPIPASLGKLADLQRLQLQDNQLTGTIPPSLAALGKLTQLNMANNSLLGAVPFNSTTVAAQVTLSGNPGLCALSGDFGLRDCSEFPPPPALPPGPPPGIPQAGGNGSPAPPPGSNPLILDPASRASGSQSKIIAGAVVAAVVLVAAVIAVVVLCLLRTKKRAAGISSVVVASSPGPPGEGEVVKAGLESSNAHMLLGSTLDLHKAQQFALEEIRLATGGFSLLNQIGVGGFGAVYRGQLASGVEVAVKKRAGDSVQGEKEFYTEVKLLSRVHHRHLVGLVGFCNEAGQQILVYEYMRRGTVRDHLYDASGTALGKLQWQRRLSIALGAAKGLEYLHTGSAPCIIHRDIKTSNILLDDQYDAKVADFGLSKLGPGGGESHVSTMVKGTAGYLDPEYFTCQQLTDRSDVYSFGVVLLELITGRPPIDLQRSRNEWSLVEWVRPNLQQGSLPEILDPTLQEEDYELEAMWKVAEVGILCVEPSGQNRPSISQVVRELQEAIEMEGFSRSSREAQGQHAFLQDGEEGGRPLTWGQGQEHLHLATNGGTALDER